MIASISRKLTARTQDKTVIFLYYTGCLKKRQNNDFNIIFFLLYLKEVNELLCQRTPSNLKEFFGPFENNSLKYIQLANSKAANFGGSDQNHDIHANGFNSWIFSQLYLKNCPFNFQVRMKQKNFGYFYGP